MNCFDSVDRIREKAIADSHRSFGSSNLDVASRLDDEVSCMNEAAIGKLLDEVRCVLQLISTLPVRGRHLQNAAMCSFLNVIDDARRRQQGLMQTSEFLNLTIFNLTIF